MQVKKRDGTFEPFDRQKIESAIRKAFLSCDRDTEIVEEIADQIDAWDGIGIEEIQDQIEELLLDYNCYDVAKSFIIYREKQSQKREFAQKKIDFINKYKESDNTANATIDDNSSSVHSSNMCCGKGDELL